MRKIITMVGTSIFENYMRDHGNDLNFSHYVEDLKDRTFEEYEDETRRINYLKNRLKEWVSQESSVDMCAETKSVAKISEEVVEGDGNFEIYFLTSDTILGNVAFEVIRDSWNNFKELRNFRFFPTDSSQACIKGLQVKDRNRFVNEGMVNLVNRIFQIVDDYWDNVIINITAGYKATIPYLTILAQVNKCPIYYIFEDTDALIKIPYIPISIDWEVFEENEDFIFDLEVNEIIEIPSNVKLKDELQSLIERADNIVSLNPLGIVLWEKYKKSFCLFMISHIVADYLENENRRSTIEKSLIELHRRLKKNPTDPDLDHRLTNIELPAGFKIFKHKEDDLQVRILYKTEEYTTRYNTKEFRVYVGLISIGQEVHNAESEYVKVFERDSKKIKDLNEYKVHRIERKEARQK